MHVVSKISPKFRLFFLAYIFIGYIKEYSNMNIWKKFQPFLCVVPKKITFVNNKVQVLPTHWI